MARRSDHTREELKAMAIAAGQKIIKNEGLSSFSARKVAKEIGYTVGTLYNVFASHDELILYINGATLDDMHDFIVKRASTSDQGIVAIKSLAASYLSFAHEHYHRWSALYEFNLQQDEPLPPWYAERIKVLFGLVERSLQPLLVDSESKQVERAAKVLWASIHGICQLGLTGKLDTVGAEPVQVLTDFLIDHYLQGLVQS